MKISSLRKGVVYELVDKTKDMYYEVVDILNDEIGGYKREVITLGNVSDKSTITVTLRNLNNPKLWDSVDGAVVVEQMEIVKKIIFLDGSEKIIEKESLANDYPKTSLLEKKKPSKKKPKKSQKKTVIVKPNVIVKPKEAEAPCRIDALIKAQTSPLIYGSDFYWNLMGFTYDDLDLLGSTLSGCVPIFEKIFIEPKLFSKDVHQQELDKFRDGSVTLRDIRAMGNRIKANTQDEAGKPVAPQTIIKRIMKSFYHWGSFKEKEALGLNRKLSELPYGRQNQLMLADRKSKKFKRNLKDS
jgi:hypothetical protein